MGFLEHLWPGGGNGLKQGDVEYTYQRVKDAAETCNYQKILYFKRHIIICTRFYKTY